MSENDQATSNVNSTPASQEAWHQRYRRLLIGGGGCAMLLCAAVLVGSGFLLSNLGNNTGLSNIVTRLGGAEETPAVATLVVVATDTPAYVPQPTLEATPTRSATPTVQSEPEIKPITFAPQVTDDNEVLNPARSFEEGIVEIHAVFEYSHMSRDYTWERVWYHDGREVLRSAESWAGDESGRFDYFLDTGGQALPAGEWVLEVYVEGQLLATGQFTVAPKEITQVPTPTLTPTLTPAPSAPPPARTYQLAYTKWDGAFHNVYIADTNGRNERLIFTRAAGPSWSPDGRQLFFFGEQGVNEQIRGDRVECEFGTISDGIVAVDLPSPPGDICGVHSGPWFCERKRIDVQSPPSDVCEQNGIRVFQNLDWKEGSARWASVAPDGQAVAYDARPGGDYRIYFRSILDTQQFRFELIGEQGYWSPDGQRLVYRSGRDNKTGLWISNRDDTGHTQITNDGSDSFPAWSPDGRTIAFSRNVGWNVDIYIVNVDGSNLRRLTDAPGHDILPTYTPGGEIIFRSDRSGVWGIWKMSGNGANQREIIPNAGVGPDWAYSRMDVKKE